VLAWGKNNAGQLGDGTKTNRRDPVTIPGLSDVTTLAAGGDHSLALKDGKVLSWGRNDFGQLGDGTKTKRLIPGQVSGLSGVTAIAAGGFHSLALDDNGTVWAWGKNNVGQLGDGTKTKRLIPVQVKVQSSDGLVPLSNIKAIAAGCSHSLALDNNGTVWAWGYNKFGQLGNGTKICRSTPVQARLSGVIAIAAGGDHSLAIQDITPMAVSNGSLSGTVWSWGRNNNGQLGDGTKINRLIPAEIEMHSVKAITAGGYHSMAIKENGEVWAWGRNTDGQLGNGTAKTTKDNLSPNQIIGLSANAFVAGYYHSLALDDDGETWSLWSWGKNSSGQLGDKTTKMRSISTKVMGE
jgi:alpha-tubulin suppressor-like RCC1 family protein